MGHSERHARSATGKSVRDIVIRRVVASSFVLGALFGQRLAEIDLVSPEVRLRFASNRGFVGQSEQTEKAAHTKERVPSCRWCERLGGTIIALLVERGVKVVTADRSFIPLGELLDRTVVFIPPWQS